ncbi:phosphoesterase [Alkalilimnicola sp. S0819]|uniref:phosphoesterase n=1 Tax=Alkalilimnicola sp. S0819 TaxID=2613922 RepID=UPI00126200A8|nr:phosphoesterase [Alkalilimnicola sp. S0819]KAB7627670.1 phosphoesterase [Alkalilimnicola sp. S0819]MPQ15837.1 phosphoesterase [Alkalilimnicola sp. S0819]
MAKPLVIYHGSNCLDGFGSAYAAWRHFALNQAVEAEYLPASHGDPLPEVADRDVYLLDFSYKRPLLRDLCAAARHVVILDHHVTAQEDLEGLDREFDNLELVFDMQRSGAVITWEYFHSAPVPRLLACVQDRDLWQWKLPESADVTAALMAHPYEFDLWHGFIESGHGVEVLATEGQAINRYRKQQIASYKRRAVMGQIAGYTVPIVNAPSDIRSELLGELAQGQPFAAGYSDTGHKRGWSLRARDGGEDVAKIAARFGGGGHAKAAGFATDLPTDLLTVEP